MDSLKSRDGWHSQWKVCVFPKSSSKRPETDAYWSHSGHVFTLNLPLWWEMESSDDWSVQFHRSWGRWSGSSFTSCLSLLLCLSSSPPCITGIQKVENGNRRARRVKGLVRGQKEIKVNLSWECPVYWFIPRALWGAKEAAGGEFYQYSYPAANPMYRTGQARWAHWYNRSKLFMGVTNPF